MTKQELELQAKKKQQEYLDILEQIKKLDKKKNKIQIRTTTNMDYYNKYYTKDNIKCYNLDITALNDYAWTTQFMEISQYNIKTIPEFYLYNLKKYRLQIESNRLDKIGTLNDRGVQFYAACYRPSFVFM